MVTDVKPLQPENAFSPIEVTLDGMVTDVKPLQPSNASSPIEVTPDGMVTDVKPLERSNIYSLLVATLVVKEFPIKNKKKTT
jgi:hypothetical protein